MLVLAGESGEHDLERVHARLPEVEQQPAGGDGDVCAQMTKMVYECRGAGVGLETTHRLMRSLEYKHTQIVELNT